MTTPLVRAEALPFVAKFAASLDALLAKSYVTGMSLEDHIVGGWSFTDALPRTTDLEEC